MSVVEKALQSAMRVIPEMVLEVPVIAPSSNRVLGQHWSKRHKLQKLWHREIGWALATAGYRQPCQPYAKARVTIDRRSRGQLDPDNLVGSCKPIIDALRSCHVLADDTPAHLELIVTQSKGSARTRIKVRRVES